MVRAGWWGFWEPGIIFSPLWRLQQGQGDNGYSIHQELYLSSPGHFEQGQDYVEYGLPSLTIPSTRNHLFLVHGTKFWLVFAGLPLTIPSIRIHLFLLQHIFNRAIGWLSVAGLLLTIPSNRNHRYLLNDTLN